MLLRKPVILCGNIYFDNAPGIMKLDDIYLNYLSAMKMWRKPSRQDVIKYLCECFSNVYEGSAYFARKDFQTEGAIVKALVVLLD